MKRIVLLYMICCISIFIMQATILNDRLFHKESYGVEVYGNSTSLTKTFNDVSVINWSATNYISGSPIYVSFRLTGADSANETFILLNQYSFKSGSVGNATSLSTYSLSGEATCSNPSYNGPSGIISFNAFTTGLN